MKVLGYYKNGNYMVSIFDDGTKIRSNHNGEEFKPSTVESIDLKITNKCNMGCPMCHEGSYLAGKHADILSESFLDKLHPYCELAIGGGNPLCHPDLEEFLYKCQQRKHIPSMTIHQHHFEQEYDRVMNLVCKRLIFGLGISLTEVTDSLLSKVEKIPNAVIHIINGLVTEEQLLALAHHNIKILILGYKEFRRGEKLYQKVGEEIEQRKAMLKSLLPKMLKENWFKVVSFDNLAIKQLDVKSCMSSEEDWNRFYMGDDGLDGKQTSATFFVDMIERKYAKNSCAPLEERFDLLDSAEEMFAHLINKNGGIK